MWSCLGITLSNGLLILASFETLASTAMPPSVLPLIDACDNCRLIGLQVDATSSVIPLLLSTPQQAVAIGLLLPIIVDQIRREIAASLNVSKESIWELFHEGDVLRGVILSRRLDTPASRSSALKELTERWRDSGLFPDQIGPKKWRSELYPVYFDPFGPRHVGNGEETPNFAFEIERSACALFGLVTYGVHMTMYRESDSSLWVPRRALSKQT